MPPMTQVQMRILFAMRLPLSAPSLARGWLGM
jgi:hypothetical protein